MHLHSIARVDCTAPTTKTRLVPAAAKRPRGRPRARETKLSRWIDATGTTREAFATKLGVNRTYLDMLCRGARRPGLALALEIERLTRGGVPAAGWVKRSSDGD